MTFKYIYVYQLYQTNLSILYAQSRLLCLHDISK